MKTLLIIIAALGIGGTALGMVGGPFYCVGMQRSVMAVEAIRTNVQLNSPGVGGTHEIAQSARFNLVARYGVTPNVDVSATAGAADLRFDKLSAGYAGFEGDWSFSWGAGVRGGMPVYEDRVQVMGAIQYLGYQPTGTASNGVRTIESQYLWHEISVSVGAGMPLGVLTPYVAVTKPYLFGRREATVQLFGQAAPGAGTQENFSDSRQPLRGTLGLEWRLPDGYSIAAEGARSHDGNWTVALGIAQALR